MSLSNFTYNQLLYTNRFFTTPTSPGYKSAAWRYAADGPYLQCACLFTVADGNANVGVGEIVVRRLGKSKRERLNDEGQEEKWARETHNDDRCYGL